MWWYTLFIVFLRLLQAEDESRFSVVSMGQGVADTFIGEVWSRISNSEFVGGQAAVYSNQREGHPVVQTYNGQVQGIVTTTSRDQKPYAAYLGIPFAKPPVGKLRFQPPQDIEPWEGILDCSKERHTCPTFRQPEKGNEDCLYLNVFTPHIVPVANNTTLPVMVFIYGGAFMGGTSNTSGYAPDFLIDKDVVLVTFNYRTGPLGFLSLQTDLAPGNAGLKDQVHALKWVRTNIRNFGGDQSKVTIFGESAGAASVGYHLVSPLSKGLFDRAILESGSPIAQWAFTNPERARAKAYHLGNRVGCILPGWKTQDEELFDCLQAAPPQMLTRLQFIGLSVEDMIAMRPLGFVPTSEPASDSAFITNHPMEYLRNGDINKVPIMMGINTAEGLLLYRGIKKVDPTGAIIAYMGQNLQKLAPNELAESSEHSSELHSRIKAFYTGRTGPTNMITLLEILKLISDTQFLLPLLQTADLISQHSDQPVYNYLFSYDGPYACYKVTENIMHLPGTSHMDELGYIFNLGPIQKVYNHSNRNTPQESVIDLMTGMWTKFASSGYPRQNKECLPFSSTESNYCDIDVTVSSKRSLMKKTVSFWNDLYQLVQGRRQIPE